MGTIDLDARVTALEKNGGGGGGGDVTRQEFVNLSNKVTTNRNNIESLTTQVTANTGEIVRLDTLTTSLNTAYSALSGRVDANDSSIETINSDILDITTEVNTLSGNVTTVESTVNTLSGKVTTVESSVNSLNTLVDNLDTNVNLLTNRVTAVESAQESTTETKSTSYGTLTINKCGKVVTMYGDLENLPSNTTTVNLGTTTYKNKAGYALGIISPRSIPYAPSGSVWVGSSGTITLYKLGSATNVYLYVSYISQ